MSRYDRQEQMVQIGLEGQAKLGAAHVVVVGAGGLGHPVASYLAGAGVGRITIIDHDVVDLSNLHRQIHFNEADIGRLKALVLAEKCAAQNRQIAVMPRPERLEPDNVISHCGDADMVIDAADSFAVTYTLSDFCRDRNVPLVAASVLGFEGYVGGFCGGVAPSVRAVFPQLPKAAQNCASAGVSGPAVGVIGSMQAQMAINIIVGIEPSPLGQMVRVDFEQFIQSRFSFLDAPEPRQGFGFISASAISEDDRVIELRSQLETTVSITPDAIQVNLDDIDTLNSVPQRTVVCCRSGLRAWNAAIQLQAKGQANIALVAAG